jgi:hypothetical protein
MEEDSVSKISLRLFDPGHRRVFHIRWVRRVANLNEFFV